MSAQGTLTVAASNKIRNLGIVCAFLVVIIHCRPHFGCGTTGWWVREIVEEGICQIAVPFFFAVSGFFLGRELLSGMGGYFHAVRKRIRTLVVPFAIWNFLFWIATLAVKNARNAFHGESGTIWFPTLRQVGFWYTGCPLLSPLWYVRALFVLVLISPLLLWCLKRFRIWFLAALFILYAAIRPYSMSNPSKFEVFARVGIFPVQGIFYFTFGLALSFGIVRAWKIRIRPVAALAVGIALFFARVAAIRLGMEGGIDKYIGFAAIPFALYGAWGACGDGKWPTWLVSNSFSVFLIHKFVLLVLREFTHWNSSLATYALTATAAFAAALGAAIIFKKLLPRTAAVCFGGR